MPFLGGIGCGKNGSWKRFVLICWVISVTNYAEKSERLAFYRKWIRYITNYRYSYHIGEFVKCVEKELALIADYQSYTPCFNFNTSVLVSVTVI